jgi:hypothetical protein
MKKVIHSVNTPENPTQCVDAGAVWPNEELLWHTQVKTKGQRCSCGSFFRVNKQGVTCPTPDKHTYKRMMTHAHTREGG